MPYNEALQWDPTMRPHNETPQWGPTMRPHNEALRWGPTMRPYDKTPQFEGRLIFAHDSMWITSYSSAACPGHSWRSSWPAAVVRHHRWPSRTGRDWLSSPAPPASTWVPALPNTVPHNRPAACPRRPAVFPWYPAGADSARTVPSASCPWADSFWWPGPRRSSPPGWGWRSLPTARASTSRQWGNRSRTFRNNACKGITCSRKRTGPFILRPFV